MSNYKVFIADDNPQIISLMKKYLEYEPVFDVVETACDGQEVLDKIKYVKPDILLLDIVMPNKDGLDVLEELNQLGMIEDVKIIMFTALGQENVIKEALNLGISYYVLKPLDPDNVIKKMKKLVVQPKETNRSINYEPQIQKELHALGVPSHLKGYMYLKDSISMVIDNHELVTQITKVLYPSIADKFNTTETRVEKSIRTAIDYAYSKGNHEYFMRSFFQRKPTNGEFIGFISDKIRINLEEIS